jgi:hypothetical protein
MEIAHTYLPFRKQDRRQRGSGAPKLSVRWWDDPYPAALPAHHVRHDNAIQFPAGDTNRCPKINKDNTATTNRSRSNAERYRRTMACPGEKQKVHTQYRNTVEKTGSDHDQADQGIFRNSTIEK